MWIDLDLPRDTDLKSIRDGVLLQVLIRQKHGNKHYTALGIIKKLVHFPSEDRKVAHLQIDLMNPLDKKKRQPIHKTHARHSESAKPTYHTYETSFDRL